MSIRWNCPYCKAEGWEQGTEKVSPRFDHDRPDGRRCRAAERARVAGGNGSSGSKKGRADASES